MMGLMLTVMMQAVILDSGAESYRYAYYRSMSTGEPLLVLVSTDWCPACRIMKSGTIPRLRQRGDLGKVAYAIVDPESQPRLARKLMQGNSIPQLVLFAKTPNGWRRWRRTGAQSEYQVRDLIRFGQNLSQQPSPAAGERMAAE